MYGGSGGVKYGGLSTGGIGGTFGGWSGGILVIVLLGGSGGCSISLIGGGRLQQNQSQHLILRQHLLRYLGGDLC